MTVAAGDLIVMKRGSDSDMAVGIVTREWLGSSGFTMGTHLGWYIFWVNMRNVSNPEFYLYSDAEIDDFNVVF